jgi:hypothetical protein
MKMSLGLAGVIAIVWLGLWLSNTGLLVYSSDTKVLKTRECSYLIGVSVVKRLELLADRCPVMRSVGP